MKQSQEARSYLGWLVSRMPMSTGAAGAFAPNSEATLTYLELLDRALEDRHVTAAEAEALVELAEHWGMSPQEVKEVHAGYLRALAFTALADGVVTETERRDLADVAEWLGLGESAIDRAIVEAREELGHCPRETLAPSCVNLGSSVCFTGAMQCTLQGQPITREMAERLALSKGLKVAPGVSKKLDLLITADPLSLSGKASKARAYGVRIVAEPVFWRMLDIAVD